jgi:aldose 1-epimerase
MHQRGWAFFLVILGGVAALAAQSVEMLKCTREPFGKLPDGTPIEQFTLTNASGMTVKVITYGGIITSVRVPDKNQRFDDVVLGFDNLEGYLKGHPYFGCITGRVANRIAKGTFTLDGKEYKLAVNNGPNALHGGLKGFDKAVWKAREVKGNDSVGVELTYRSVDGEEGYPGNLDVKVTYSLTLKNELRIDYQATTDKPTPINLTNHSYFNLAGAGDVLDHQLYLAADQFTPTDATLIPTGEIKSVAGTPLDFTQPTPIGKRINELKGKDLPGGYDHNFVLRSGGKELALAGWVHDPKSGRLMEVWTTEPGIQLYTGNFLDGSNVGKGGAKYGQHAALCLETQHFPDSVHHPHFPSVILTPGKQFQSTTVYKFAIK